MRDPETFKYDVRVRERMIKAGRLSPDDLARQLESLTDVEANLIAIELDQPALARSEGRGDAASRPVAVAVAPTAVVAPVVVAVTSASPDTDSDSDSDDDESDDLSDEEDEPEQTP
jgi:hypothetical protein